MTTGEKPRHNCDRELEKSSGVLDGCCAAVRGMGTGDYVVATMLSAFRAKDGDLWQCPCCGKVYVHICDEAEGALRQVQVGEKP